MRRVDIDFNEIYTGFGYTFDDDLNINEKVICYEGNEPMEIEGIVTKILPAKHLLYKTFSTITLIDNTFRYTN